MSPRWIELWCDAVAERGRFALMLPAVVALAALGAVLGAYAVLTREMASEPVCLRRSVTSSPAPACRTRPWH